MPNSFTDSMSAYDPGTAGIAVVAAVLVKEQAEHQAFRATVADALAELREKFRAQDATARSYETGWNDALHCAITTIAKLGLEEER